MPQILRKLINIFIIFKIFYLYTARSTIRYFLGKNDNIQKQWSIKIFEYLKVKLFQFQGSHELKEEKIIVYANHRSQADFFLVNFLSRLAVLLVFPVFYFARKQVWFFNRNNKTDPQKFNQWLDKKFTQSPREALLVYPEGHRMYGIPKVDKSKLKTGMIRYNYRKQIPAQILISFGNQEIFDQKRLHIAYGQTCFYKISEVINPKDFNDEKQYVQFIKQKFCQFFDEVYELTQKQKLKKQKQQESQFILNQSSQK